MKKNQSLFDITTRVLTRFDPLLKKFKPDLVLVHGDTTTTLGGALSSYYKKVPVAHVEAGLRTRDKYRPFPEEINRRLTDAVASLHLAPTALSRANLLKENIPAASIVTTGNTVIDALYFTAKKKGGFQHPALRKLNVLINNRSNRFILLTAHRRENFGAPFKAVFQGIKELSQKYPAVHWVYPVHPNPNVKDPAKKILGGLSNVHLVPPLNYFDLVKLMKRSTLVVTDSGGLQEEAPSLGKPVLVLRDITERPEAVKAGTVKVIGTKKASLIRNVSTLLTNKTLYNRMARAVNPYGDGKASGRIKSAITQFFARRQK